MYQQVALNKEITNLQFGSCQIILQSFKWSDDWQNRIFLKAASVLVQSSHFCLNCREQQKLYIHM